MNHDEFAFFNHQLAAMLRDGIPLEGALRQLASGMRDRKLQAELEGVRAELAKGTPLSSALGGSRLPEFYKRMVEVGSRSNDLPGILTLLADHYQRTNAIWTRLKGLMVYPVLVISVSLALTLLLTLVFRRFLGQMADQMGPDQPGIFVTLWFPPILIGLAAAAMACAMFVPSIRAWLRWRLPAFRDASLAQLASALALMLRNGLPLSDALALAELLESGTPAARALARWRAMVQAGEGKPARWHEPPRPLAPFFLWLIQQSGEDVAGGLQKAAGIYEARAGYRIELALYGALPVSILLLGQMILWQLVPMFATLKNYMGWLGDFGM